MQRDTEAISNKQSSRKIESKTWNKCTKHVGGSKKDKKKKRRTSYSN